MPRLLPSTKPWILIRRIRCASFIALQFYSQWINIRYGAVLRRLLILGRGRQLVQDLISSSKRKVRECIVCEATVLLSTSSQVYTCIGILHKWGLYDKNHITSFVLRCAIFAKKNSSCDADGCCVFSRQDEAVSRVPNLSQLDVWYGKVQSTVLESLCLKCVLKQLRWLGK